jgi:hypothetical protein
MSICIGQQIGTHYCGWDQQMYIQSFNFASNESDDGDNINTQDQP